CPADYILTSTLSLHDALPIFDNEDQVIQFFTGSDGDRTFGFRFVHFTVAEERVNGLFRGIFQATVFQIFQEHRGLKDTSKQTVRSEEHTSELQSRFEIVRLPL